jgi:hypothetical protein
VNNISMDAAQFPRTLFISMATRRKNVAERQTTLHHRQTHQRLLALKHFTQHHICHFGNQSLYLNLITLSHFMHWPGMTEGGFRAIPSSGTLHKPISKSFFQTNAETLVFGHREVVQEAGHGTLGPWDCFLATHLGYCT